MFNFNYFYNISSKTYLQFPHYPIYLGGGGGVGRDNVSHFNRLLLVVNGLNTYLSLWRHFFFVLTNYYQGIDYEVCLVIVSYINRRQIINQLWADLEKKVGKRNSCS